MAKQQKEVHKVKMTDGKRAIIQQLFQEYDIESTSDIQDALKDLLGGTIKEMMEVEMDSHLGYENPNAPPMRTLAMGTNPRH
ncbi:hypothetical protein HMPREF9162_1735 [Selenomonas sp. oral taxon 137 str. F0430]|uniref:conserved domain protein n=1 Tax=Selenomonas sp. oral taxon 137 TaxID=712531 RepID=UPI0001EB1E7F|nr:conserved domain protein [Selenomonas sp. oral taxon 137]EFR41244.1 hypothetical protein HMPREF9162_1735 [Selenomonas sp. oral taxon 137 str. F0430]